MAEARGRRVLVVGASGNLGRKIALALGDEGFDVRVMARRAKKLEELFGDRFEIVAGDAKIAASVQNAMHGCWGVHVCVSHGGDEAPLVERVVEAAQKHQLGRISYVSGTSVREENAWYPMVRDKLRAEKAVVDSGIPWTILRPTWVNEVIENFFQHGKAICFGAGEFQLHLLASTDLAKVLARAYASPEAENRAFRVLGPEPIRLTDALERLRAVKHPQIAKVTHVPFLLASLIAALRGREGEKMKDAARFVRYFEQIEEGEPDPEVTRLCGDCTTRFEDWLAQMA
jgi:uncharacterized protein YbjT (DUF2867 family)